SPAEALTCLNEMVFVTGDEYFATVCAVVADPRRARIEWATAGHPPPVLKGPGTAEVISGGLGPPIGVDASSQYPGGARPLRPGDTLVLYTDGLVERRGHDLSLDELVLACQGAPSEPEELIRHVVAKMVTDSREDDMAVMAVQFVPVRQAMLEVAFPPEPASVAGARAAIRELLAPRPGNGNGAAYQVDAVALAVSEALTNAVEHSASQGPVQLRAERTEADLTVTVTDSGRWRLPAPGPARGRGIPIMRALAEVEIDAGARGTRVTLRFMARQAVPAPASPPVPESPG
ncbi:MAG: SpoIIE family protein phosphatase, partial [Acidimicrobiales bacterium]